MARALWKGAITFGLVNIPVELYPAEDRKSFKFAMLDKRDLTPVGYKRYSKGSGKEVEWADIVKGYPPLMPPQQLTDAEIVDVVDFIKALK